MNDAYLFEYMSVEICVPLFADIFCPALSGIEKGQVPC